MFRIGKYVGTHRARYFFTEIMERRFDIHVVLRNKRVKHSFRRTHLGTMKPYDSLQFLESAFPLCEPVIVQYSVGYWSSGMRLNEPVLTLVDKCHSNTDRNKGLLTLRSNSTRNNEVLWLCCFSSSWNRLFVLIFSVVRTNHSEAFLDTDMGYTWLKDVFGIGTNDYWP